MCGSSSAQKQISNEQQGFYDQLNQGYAKEFAGQEGILSSLQEAFSPILAGGINQQGFSAAENAALNTAAINNAGASYRNAAQAAGEAMAGRGGGNMYLPSGTNAAITASLASNAAGQLAGQQNQIQLANYAQGRQNFMGAAGALSSAANIYNPTGAANAATGAGSAAMTSANQMQAQGQQWIGALGGALGGFTSALGGGAAGGLMGMDNSFGNFFK